MDLRAPLSGRASAVVLEARVDRKTGASVTLVVRRGTLKVRLRLRTRTRTVHSRTSPWPDCCRSCMSATGQLLLTLPLTVIKVGHVSCMSDPFAHKS
jgi:hypothetical protein